MLFLFLSMALASPPQALLDATAHSWKLAEDAATTQATIDAGVQQAAQGFPALVRPFVRRVLAKHAFYCRQIDLSPTAESWTSACVDDGNDYSRNWSDQPHVFTGKEGDEITSVLTHDDASVTLDFQGGGGGRKATYRPTQDGLQLSISIYSEQLPKPLEFTLDYVRVE